MTMTVDWFLTALSLAGLTGWVIGVWFGMVGEARKWREKAENGTRRASGGRLYHVTLDEDLRGEP